MGCCGSKQSPWDMNFKETTLSSNRCDAVWENISGELATFGMSPHFSPCARFGILPGVIRCKVGFAGGTSEYPTYEDIGDYTLAVQVEYDPKKIQYEQLFYIFWNYHDIFLPCETPANQSTIFYHTMEQKAAAQEEMEKQQAKHDHEIATVLKAYTTFVTSDDEHQHFILQSNKDIMKILSKRLHVPQMAHSHLACRLEGYVAGYNSPESFDRELPELFIPENLATLVRSACVQNQVPEPGADHMNDWG